MSEGHSTIAEGYTNTGWNKGKKRGKNHEKLGKYPRIPRTMVNSVLGEPSTSQFLI